MTLHELATILGADVEIGNTSGGGWHCSISHLECKITKESKVLRSETGFGDTPDHAAFEYAAAISGKWGVWKAQGGTDRREFSIPTVTYK